jgi:hypothetical protein
MSFESVYSLLSSFYIVLGMRRCETDASARGSFLSVMCISIERKRNTGVAGEQAAPTAISSPDVYSAGSTNLWKRLKPSTRFVWIILYLQICNSTRLKYSIT